MYSLEQSLQPSFSFSIFDIAQRSQRRALIPDALQEHVNSVYCIIVFSGRPVGLALTGVLLQNSGITTTILLLTGDTSCLDCHA